MRNFIEFQASGELALFTDPIIGSGGGRCSLPVPTYEALKGLCCSVYRDISFEWVIDAVRIMNPVRTEAFAVMNGQKGSVALDCFLKNVRYQVRAGFVPRVSGGEFNVGKILGITRRSLKRGGRRETYLGTRVCGCTVEECRFGDGSGWYDSITEDMGMMYHGLSYGDDGSITARMFRCLMERGVIRFPTPEQCKVVSVIKEGYACELV